MNQEEKINLKQKESRNLQGDFLMGQNTNFEQKIINVQKVFPEINRDKQMTKHESEAGCVN